jgi:hypothetical protein
MEKENWLDALNDDVRDIRALTVAVRNETEVMKEELKETKRKADAAWELVIMTREQIKEEIAYLKKPIWKKWLGAN